MCVFYDRSITVNKKQLAFTIAGNVTQADIDLLKAALINTSNNSEEIKQGNKSRLAKENTTKDVALQERRVINLYRKPRIKQILIILIAAAWITGVIQPEERAYIRRLAEDYQLADDPEIKPLLSELRPIQAVECYQLLEEYFGENYTEEAYFMLLEKISGLVYADGYVDVREAKLIEAIQSCDPANPDNKNSILDRMLREIRTIFRISVEQNV